MAKSAKEKLIEQSKKLPRIVQIPKKMEKRFGKGKMLIPKPLDVDAIIRKVKKGRLITQEEIREILAKKFKVKVTCPITTGIFVRICAEAAEEDKKLGKKRVTPWWRVISSDGSLSKKFPGAPNLQAKYLKKEGFKLIKGRNSLKVENFEKCLKKVV